MATTPPSRLLTLPREIRDLVYAFYLIREGGYVYHMPQRKFTGADGRLIDLDLTLTCRQIANELEGLPFSLNKLIFTTWCPISYPGRKMIHHHEIVFSKYEYDQQGIFSHAAPRFTKALETITDRDHPEFAPYLKHVSNHSPFIHDDTGDYFLEFPRCIPRSGEANSLLRRFVTSALRHCSLDPSFIYYVEKDLCWNPAFNMKHTDWFRAQVDPWAIPKDDCKWVMASNDIRDQFPGSERYLGGHSERLDLTLSYRYSAAAVAIEFLGSCSSNQHRNIRHMVLDEDLVAIAHPASHAQGLIPYCQKNPKMRIERRVDMWRNLLPGGATPFQTYAAQSYRKDELEAKYVTNAVGDWIIEANALSSLGMPTDVFSLVLDGGETAERTSEVFKTVHRDCAWQKAFEISVTRSHFNIPPDISRWGHRSCGYRGLPKAIKDMVQGNSIVKCNFDTGGIWDEQEIEELVQEGRNWSFRMWRYGWYTHGPRLFQPASPLPCWRQLCAEVFERSPWRPQT